MNSLPSTRTDSLEAAHCGCGHDHGPAAGASEKTGHGHDHGPVTSIGPRLLAGVAINLVICISQLVGGLLANSLGLLSDALHNLSDVVSLALSYGTHRAGQPPSTPRRTFAYNRVEVLVALFNAAALLSSNWLTEQELEDGLALVQLYPGPIGVDLVAYVGFKLRGVPGAVVAATSFLLPSFLLMLVLSALYFTFGNLPWIPGLFVGLEAVVVGILLHLTLDLGGRNLRSRPQALIGLGAFVGLLFRVNAVLLVLAALALGSLWLRPATMGGKGGIPRDVPLWAVLTAMGVA